MQIIDDQEEMAVGREHPDWLRHIQDIIECPVCMEVMLDPPVFICENEHGLCVTCRHEQMKRGINLCPVCKGQLTERRNLMIEQILLKLPRKKCKFLNCDFSKSASELVDKHEADCKHRWLACYHCECEVPLSEMLHHFATQHRAVFNELARIGFPCAPFSEDHCVHNFGRRGGKFTEVYLIDDGYQSGEYFQCFINFFLDDERFLIWISHNQSKFARQEFKYTISLRCGKAKERGKELVLVEYTAFCQPMDVSLASIKKNMFCLVVPQHVLMEALDSEDRLFYQFLVNKVE